jgi:hypothetical protein
LAKAAQNPLASMIDLNHRPRHPECCARFLYTQVQSAFSVDRQTILVFFWMNLMPAFKGKAVTVVSSGCCVDRLKSQSVAAGSLRFSDSMAWGAAYGQ